MTSGQSKGKYIGLNQMSVGIFWNFQIENRETYKNATDCNAEYVAGKYNFK